LLVENGGMGSVLPQTPWGGHEDYDFPASVGAVSYFKIDLLSVRIIF
jgi:hypothetical protein